MASDPTDPLIGYTPDWRKKQASAGADPLAGYTPGWRKQPPETAAAVPALTDEEARSAIGVAEKSPVDSPETVALPRAEAAEPGTPSALPRGERPAAQSRPGTRVSILEAIKRIPGRAAGSIVEGIGGTLQIIGTGNPRQIIEKVEGEDPFADLAPPQMDFLNPAEAAVQNAGDRIAEKGARMQAERPISAEAMEGNWATNPRWWLEVGGPELLVLAAQVGAAKGVGSVAGPAAATGAFVATNAPREVGLTFRQLEAQLAEQGDPDATPKAAQAAIGYGILSSALETIPGRLFAEPLQALAFRRFLQGAVREGGTEVAQTIASAAARFSAGDETAFDDIAQEAVQSGALGSVLGGGAATVVGRAPTAASELAAVERSGEEQASSESAPSIEVAEQEVVPRREDAETAVDYTGNYSENIPAALEAGPPLELADAPEGAPPAPSPSRQVAVRIDGRDVRGPMSEATIQAEQDLGGFVAQLEEKYGADQVLRAGTRAVELLEDPERARLDELQALYDGSLQADRDAIAREPSAAPPAPQPDPVVTPEPDVTRRPEMPAPAPITTGNPESAFLPEGAAAAPAPEREARPNDAALQAEQERVERVTPFPRTMEEFSARQDEGASPVSDRFYFHVTDAETIESRGEPIWFSTEGPARAGNVFLVDKARLDLSKSERPTGRHVRYSGDLPADAIVRLGRIDPESDFRVTTESILNAARELDARTPAATPAGEPPLPPATSSPPAPEPSAQSVAAPPPAKQSAATDADVEAFLDRAGTGEQVRGLLKQSGDWEIIREIVEETDADALGKRRGDWESRLKGIRGSGLEAFTSERAKDLAPQITGGRGMAPARERQTEGAGEKEGATRRARRAPGQSALPDVAGKSKAYRRATQQAMRLSDPALLDTLEFARGKLGKNSRSPLLRDRVAALSQLAVDRGLIDPSEVPAEPKGRSRTRGVGRPALPGNPAFVRTASGELDFGSITAEMVRGITGKIADHPALPAPIRLTRTRRRKIQRDHGPELEREGLTVEELVEEVASGFHQIRRGEGDSLLLVKPDGRAKAMYVELRPESGGYWTVGSAHFKPMGEIEKRGLLWESARRDSTGSDPSSDLPKVPLDPEAKSGGQTGISTAHAGPQQPTDNIADDADEGESGALYRPETLPTRARTQRPPDPLRPDTKLPIGADLVGRLTPPPKPEKGKPVSAPQVIWAMGQVAKTAGKEIPMRVGRIGARNALGIFKVQDEVIRIRQANDIPTSAHELAHALEKIVFGWPKGGPWKSPRVSTEVQRELGKLGRDLYGSTQPAGGYKREGWAEFVRLWMTTDDAATRAPALHRWFENEFSTEFPQIRGALDQARDLAGRWRMQGARARAEASIVDPAAPGTRAKRKAEEIRRSVSMEQMVDMAEPLNQLAREAEKRMGRALAPGEDPFLTTSALRTTHAARARYMVEHGMIDLRGNRYGGSLNDAVAIVRKRRTDFTLYLWARRAVKLWTDPKGSRNPGLSLQDARQIISELDGPEFQLAASKVYEWSEGVLNYAAQASTAFAEVVEKTRERDPGDYLPLQREFDDLDSLWDKVGGSAASNTSPVKRLKGSGRRIKDPFQSLIAKAESTIRAAHERMVLEQIVALSKVEGLGHIIEEVPVERVPVASVSVKDLLDQLNREMLQDGAGVKMEGADIDLASRALTFFAPARAPKGQDPIVPMWEDGRLRWYQVEPDLYHTLRSLDVYRIPNAGGLLGMGVHLIEGSAATVRAFTTGLRASFAFWNTLRDVQTFYMNTRSRRNGGVLFGAWLRSMAEAAFYRGTGGAKLHTMAHLDAFVRLGGEMAQPLGQDVPHTRRAAHKLFQGRAVRVIDPRNWFDFYRDLIQFSESAPRVAELRLVAKEVGWRPGEPMTLDQSLHLLLAAKQVTTDFTAAGEFARVMNRIVPFFNAAIQGPRASLRAVRRNPRQFVWRGMQLASASLLLWWQYKDEDWYREMDAREKFLHWHFPFQWNGRDELLRIPRAFDTGAIFSALPEMFIDAWYEENPEKAKAWFETFLSASIPNPLGLPILSEALEQAANKDFFFDRPIVPMGETRQPEEEQFNEYTSRAAIVIGDVFNVSPRRIDHAIRGLAGPAAADLVELLGKGPKEHKGKEIDRERELADLPIIGRAFQRGGTGGTQPRSVRKLYDSLEEARKRQHSTKIPETPEQRNLRLQLEDAARALSFTFEARALAETVQERRTLSREALSIARDAVRHHESGILDRPKFKEARLIAEQRLK